MDITIPVNVPELTDAISALIDALYYFRKEILPNMPVSPGDMVESSGSTGDMEADSMKSLKDKPPVIEEIRKMLMEKSKADKQGAVKDLIKRYGGEKLTDVHPSMLPSLKKDAEEL